MRTSAICLLLICTVAFGTRVFGLANYPTGLTPDEAAQGFSAYSLLTTGKDEWGNKWPINLRSFGDFKPPLYTYLAIPSIAAFGLNEFSVRFPSALLGVLAVVLTYILTIKLTKDERIALVAAGLLALSPWHIALSRGAFEANLSTSLLTAGMLFFLLGIEKSAYLIPAAFLFGLNLFSYHSARLVTPILVVALIIWKYTAFNWKNEDVTPIASEHSIVSSRRQGRFVMTSLLATIIFVSLFLIAGYTFFSGGATRTGDIAIFHPTDNWAAVADARFEAVKAGLPDLITRLFTNKITYTANVFTKSYLSYFSTDFLFLNGPGEGTYGMIPGRGVLYLFEIVTVGSALLLLISTFRYPGNEVSENSGIFQNQPIRFGIGRFWSQFCRQLRCGKASLNDRKMALLFLLLWIAVAAVPAALAKGYHAANRDAIAMPAWQILSAIGLVYLYDDLVAYWPKYKRGIQYFVFSIIALSFLTFAYDYVYHAPVQNAKAMHYGMSEAAHYIKANRTLYQQIVISRKLSEPQAYAGFYGLITPEQFQAAAPKLLQYEREGKGFLDQLGVYTIGDFTFLEIPHTLTDPKTLYVGTFEELHDNKGIVKQINFPNGDPAIILARL